MTNNTKLYKIFVIKSETLQGDKDIKIDTNKNKICLVILDLFIITKSYLYIRSTHISFVFINMKRLKCSL